MYQIRLNKTPEIEKVLDYLQSKYRILSEAEIIKVALSEKYNKERAGAMEEEQNLREAYAHLMKEGKKLGIKLMRKKGLDPDKVTEQEFYDLFFDTHKHNA